MSRVLVLSLTSALNPTLLTATTVMLLLPNAKRLMLGYWLGAMMTSITLGLVIVFALLDTRSVSTTKHTLSPSVDIALGVLALVLAVVIGTGRDKPVAARRAKRREGKAPPRWQRKLNEGTARTTFVIGALLTLPGASYLAGLTEIHKLHYSTAETVLIVIGFNLVMMILLEGPLIAFALAPEQAAERIDRAKTWVSGHARRYGTWFFAAVGVALVVKGIIGLLQ
jgi:hypothetical protein